MKERAHALRRALANLLQPTSYRSALDDDVSSIGQDQGRK
jgi:hypothetical protein